MTLAPPPPPTPGAPRSARRSIAPGAASACKRPTRFVTPPPATAAQAPLPAGRSSAPPSRCSRFPVVADPPGHFGGARAPPGGRPGACGLPVVADPRLQPSSRIRTLWGCRSRPTLAIRDISSRPASRREVHRRPAGCLYVELELLAADGDGLLPGAAAVVHDGDQAAVGVLDGDGVAAGGGDDLGARVGELREVTEHVVGRRDVQLARRGVDRQQRVLRPRARGR